MAAVRHLGFLKVGNFNSLYPSEGQNTSSCQILCKSVKALWTYGRFRFFTMAAVRHLEFSKVGNFNCPYPFEGQNASPCQILCRSVKPLRRYGLFWFFKMAAVRHLRFSNVGNLNCPYSSEVQSASSCQILCKSVKALRRYGRFRFFKMAAVRHVGFVIRLFGLPTKCILVVCHSAKFGLNRFSSFDNMQVLIFWALSWKMPIHAHFWGVLGGKNRRNRKIFVVLSL